MHMPMGHETLGDIPEADVPAACQTFKDYKAARMGANADLVAAIDAEMATALEFGDVNEVECMTEGIDIYDGMQPSDETLKEEWAGIQQSEIEGLGARQGARYTGTILEIDTDFGHVIQSNANDRGAITHDLKAFGDTLPELGQRVTVTYGGPDQAKWIDRTPARQSKDKGMTR